MKNYLASAIGALQGLSSEGAAAASAAAGNDPLLARAAPAAIGAGIGALAAGANQRDVVRAAETFGLAPASRALGIGNLMQQQQRQQQAMPVAMQQPQMPMQQPMQPMPMQPMAMPMQGQMQQPMAMPMQPQMQQPMPMQGPIQQPMQPQMQQPFARGGYVTGPGTGRSDDIPAMIFQNGRPVQRAALSDGEFVMTERAVRGAGDGDRAKGAARMYRIMREFEKGGRV